jgi:hypothetical protein
MVGAAVLLVGSGLRAQEAVPPEGAVTLAYRFKTGQLQKFKGSIKSTLTATPEGNGGGFGPIPIEVSGSFGYSEKVMGTRGTAATLASSVQGVNLTMGVLGNNFQIKFVNGRPVASMNGKPAPSGVFGGAPGGLENLAPTKAVSLQRDASGATALPAGSAIAAASNTMVGGSALSAFPELSPNPVKAGDNWETTRKIRTQLPGAAGSTATEVEIHTTYTLKALETRNGRQIAVIETAGSGAAPTSGGGDALTQNVTGTTRFDVERGVVVGAQMTADLTAKAPAPQLPGVAAGSAPGTMRLDASVETRLTETPGGLPPSRARPPARGKKPLRKK